MMRSRLIFLLLAPLLFLQCLYPAGKSLSLAEKLAIAKRMADDAVAGKAEMGRVVSGGFSFNDIVKEYRSKDLSKIKDAPLATGGDITDVNDDNLKQPLPIQEESEPVVEKIPENADVRVERIENERLHAEIEEKSDFIKKRAFEEKTEILELYERPDGFPKIDSSPKGISPDAGKNQHALHAKQTSEIPPLSGREDSAAKPEDKKSDVKSGQTGYVVDTSGDDFINGYFVGKIGGKQVKSDKGGSQQNLGEKEKQPEPKQRYYSAQNGMFYLVTDDHGAIGTGYDFIRVCAALFDAYFSETGSPISLTRKITLQLVSNKNFKMNGDFSVMLYDDGEVILAAKWSDGLDFDGFCKLLTGAALRKVSLESGGLENWKNPPYWLELAMAQALAQEMRFGTAVDLARIAAKNPPPDMESILKFSRSDKIDPRIMDAHSYWMLRSLEKAARTRQALAEFLKFSLKNPGPDKTKAAFASAFVPSFYDFDTWWRCLITGEIWARLGGVNTPEWSDSEIMRLAIIQTDSQSGERVGVSDLDIFKNRELIQDELNARLMEIKVAMAKMNPLYYNSLVSLGRMYEAALDGDEDDFKAAHSDFLGEYKNARVLSAAAENMMREDIASSDTGRESSSEPAKSEK